ncbi:MAG: NAD-dependent epimerase/dehydratase family protein [Fermentimonas sp.]|nr:NAD-dependent epimerase/dehydratase family protein [Fermentimonas sp.]
MILVLGATGFLGKTVCRILDQEGREYITTSLSNGVDLREHGPTIELFESARPSIVLNCASFVGGIQYGYKYPVDLLQNNIRMTANILEACQLTDVKRLINPISNCVYPADASLFREPEIWNGPMHESVMVYGFVRKAYLIAAYAYKKQFDQEIVNIVLSNMYGPGDHFEEERSHAIGALIMKMVRAKALMKDEVIVWGTGKPVREWLHVNDGATALVKAIEMPYVDHPVNVGVATGISVKELAFMIKEAVGYHGELVFDPSKPDGAEHKTVDGSLGAELLKWHPSIALKTGIEDTVAWYMENKE